MDEKREMTLKEYVYRVSPTHLARREYEELLYKASFEMTKGAALRKVVAMHNVFDEAKDWVKLVAAFVVAGLISNWIGGGG